ncbi:hypothetical protein C8R44DRAFT_750779 [Mycena epipterygia]|nr:hypothetical protein C8R44DRAFT_750779 [Mycena epipterygia]
MPPRPGLVASAWNICSTLLPRPAVTSLVHRMVISIHSHGVDNAGYTSLTAFSGLIAGGIAVLRVASGNPWLARPPNPAEPRLADARRWAALAAHGLDRLAAASRHLAGTSGYLWIGGAVGIRSLNAVTTFWGRLGQPLGSA